LLDVVQREGRVGFSIEDALDAEIAHTRWKLLALDRSWWSAEVDDTR
jgi:hypothetical protein